MQDLEHVIRALFAEMRREIRGARPLPRVLTKKMACRELSCGLTKLDSMIKRQVILTCEVDGKVCIPSSEIDRLARANQTDPEPPRPSGRRRQTPKPHQSAVERAAEIRRKR